jgi:hypothetical protein
MSNDLDIPSRTFSKRNYDMDNPIAYYLNKKTKKPYQTEVLRDHHKLVIDAVFNGAEVSKDKKVRGFWDFLKGKSNDEN